MVETTGGEVETEYGSGAFQQQWHSPNLNPLSRHQYPSLGPCGLASAMKLAWFQVDPAAQHSLISGQSDKCSLSLRRPLKVKALL